MSKCYFQEISFERIDLHIGILDLVASGPGPNMVINPRMIDD